MLQGGVSPTSRRRSIATRTPGSVARLAVASGTQHPQAARAPARGVDVRQTDLGTHRPLVILALMVIAAGALVARLMFWQVMQHDNLQARAVAQRTVSLVAAPMRGAIFDANGSLLATNVTANLVYAVPRKITSTTKTAEALSPVLNTPVKTLEDLFSGNSPYAVLVSSNVSPLMSDKIQSLGLPGILLEPVVRRTYPEGSFASQLLGFADTDNKGNYGVEGYYDRPLSGVAGLHTVLKDTAGNDIRLSSAVSTPSHNGARLHLTIDRSVQGLVEDELHKAVTAHHADGGTVIVMDPRTGYILGMAGAPSYDPNTYARTARQDAIRFMNPATQWTYEPGSTFKIVTMAAGLDAHVITPASSFYDSGLFTIADVQIHNWNLKGFGVENMTQVLQHSANVGASWVAGRLGINAFYTYIHRFQFGQQTGIDLQAEEPGIVPLPGQKSWTIVNLYTNSFGQGISVTPIQMIRAAAAIANGGVMMKPQIVKQMDYDGGIIDHPPVSQGRVISTQTSHTLTNMLLHSAIDGEASLALVKGYNIAAKTGTANIADSTGHYIQGATIASVVGYAPAFHPRFVILVILQHPRDTPWGSMAAAPVLHNLFQELFLHYHIAPSPHALNR